MTRKLILLALVSNFCLIVKATNKLDGYLSFFKPEHKPSFLEKIGLKKPLEFAELIITPKLRETRQSKLSENLIEFTQAEWDYQTNYTKVVIFNPSKSGTALKPVNYGIANQDDKLVCDPENSGTYELSDEDIEYLKKVYDIEISKRNRDVFISYYQAVCMFDTTASKRLIVLDDGKSRSATALKYDSEFYNALIRTDYEWFNKTAEN